MIPKNYNENDFIEDLTNPLADIMSEVQYNVLAVISRRLNAIGKLSASDTQKLSQIVKMEDLNTIESIIKAGTSLSIKEIDNIINESAKMNDNLAENLYKARNMPGSNFKTDTSLLNIIEQARKSIKDGIVNLSDTQAVGLVVNGEFKSMKQAYNYAINRAVFEVQQGLFDYNTSVRSLLVEMAKNGINTKVQYESGYKRRLDSAVMMNVQDGIRQTNMAYRKQQSKQYGGDRVFISMHGLCGTDHLRINGQDYSLKEWQRVSSGLARQVGTLNCKHYITYGIDGISQNPYSDRDRKQAANSSNKQVEYTTLKKDTNGNYEKKTLTKYEASQQQKAVETDIRRLKDVRNQLELNGDTIGSAEYSRKIKEKTKYYKYMSNEMGLETNNFRLRVYSPKN